MLVRQVTTNAATGEVTEQWVDMPDVVTEAVGVQQTQAAATVAATAATNETTIGQQIDAALAANATYLAITAPTNAQVVSQVNKLTRECSGLIRLLRRKLDSMGGT